MENRNTLNCQQTAKTDEKPRPYDPILDDPISSDDENSKSEGESSDEGVDVDFPREDADDLLASLHREITNIQNLEDAQKRKFALLRLYEIFVLAKNKATKQVYQEILPHI